MLGPNYSSSFSKNRLPFYGRAQLRCSLVNGGSLLQRYVTTAAPRDRVAQPVGILSADGEQHLVLSDVTQKFRCSLDGKGLAGGQFHWQDIGVDQSIELFGRASPASCR